MFSSLKFILIVIFFHFQLSSSIEDLDADTASKVKTILMFCIAGGILVTMIILMCVVICLYRKVSYALRPPKSSGCLALSHQGFVTQDKVTGVTAITLCLTLTAGAVMIVACMATLTPCHRACVT